ncbi:MAG: glycosyl hydrolase 53 family protein, partial [Paludibacteraceae bacterium]|nr:glycosyl hydrolase 53 family protein [Paludibacteraceae bacterium]
MKTKTFLLALAVLACASCAKQQPAANAPYAYGADISWLTEQERDSVIFRDLNGNADECMHLLQGIGMNSVRLRVWVNHETGWCNLPDLLVKARRADSLGLRLMIDFHYSDFFADPHRQDVPAQWLTWQPADGVTPTSRDTIA